MQSLQLPTELRPGWYPGSRLWAQISVSNGTELEPTQEGRESRTGELLAPHPCSATFAFAWESAKAASFS